MSKRIVFCADGTWQSPRSNTNVSQLFNGLTTSPDQVKFYEPGVGALNAGIDHVIAGAFGEGLLQSVKNGYTDFAHTYEKDNDLFLFGFSRGAYIARSVAGMIAVCGLPAGAFDQHLVDQAFNAYRERDPIRRKAILDSLADYKLEDCCIRMVGVFDTVGSLGIPAIFGGVDQSEYAFLDTGLHPDVKNAFQCLAIDERRREFPATLWTSPPRPDQTLEQVWFAGGHGDIGGGTPTGGGVDETTTLSNIPLAWMLSKAMALGLVFDAPTTALAQAPAARFALDLLHESWKPLYGLPNSRPIAPDSHIANSVQVRVTYALTYVPPNLTTQDGTLAPTYTRINVVDEDAI
jgi:uncharacterized protein (DUF2235 family)